MLEQFEVLLVHAETKQALVVLQLELAELDPALRERLGEELVLLNLSGILLEQLQGGLLLEPVEVHARADEELARGLHEVHEKLSGYLEALVVHVQLEQVELSI